MQNKFNDVKFIYKTQFRSKESKTNYLHKKYLKLSPVEDSLLLRTDGLPAFDCYHFAQLRVIHNYRLVRK
jgi:hypothetical protein